MEEGRNNVVNDLSEKVSFSVDAGIISRLGQELIGRSETGVSELIKNSYDADATLVQLDFINSNVTGGKLTIEDDGHGMTREEFLRGFMTLSTTSKIHEPKSPKFGRGRAGRKGIGRFAAQFLGEKLTIVTQVKNADRALQITIDWNSYKIDRDLASVENSIEYIEKTKVQGTILSIENLRHSWSVAQIKRVFRYISDLLQPSSLSENSATLNIAKQGDESFLVECYRTENGLRNTIADLNKILFEKSLAEIDGYVDTNFFGYVNVNSNSFDINDCSLPISSDKSGSDLIKPFEVLQNVRFKVYYFIYDRQEYYKNGITKLELNNIEDLAALQSGIRVYRNGFRVLPYGEVGDDWLGLDRRRTRIDVELEEAKVTFNIPYTNKNFFGFVELLDQDGILFEETASREGMIENLALIELKIFIRKAIIAGIRRLSPFVYKEKQKRDKQKYDSKSLRGKLEGLQSKIEEFTNTGRKLSNDLGLGHNHIESLITEIEEDFATLLDELAMLRILATLGITIGEFTHEIIQFPIFFESKLRTILNIETDQTKIESLNQVIDKINHLDTYTSYFNDAVSRNSKRDLENIELRRVIRPFIESTKWDFEHENILVEEEILDYELFTIPMHPSEWHSILLNLYTNSKKALRRAKPIQKKLKVSAGRAGDFVYVEFSDNGDGIAKEYESRIFDAFFTTSSPTSLSVKSNEQLIGSGLGLKILKDIIQEYKGEIFLAEPPEGFVTCMRIEIPRASDEQIRQIEELY